VFAIILPTPPDVTMSVEPEVRADVKGLGVIAEVELPRNTLFAPKLESPVPPFETEIFEELETEKLHPIKNPEPKHKNVDMQNIKISTTVGTKILLFLKLLVAIDLPIFTLLSNKIY
jgi:hypothetical protein